MKLIKPLLLILLLCLPAHAEILRLSLVVPKAGEGVSKFEISYGESKETIFVKDQPIVTSADVATAHPSPARKDSVLVSLSPEGEKKMFQASKIMRHGVDRIAIILDGKLISAPIVNDTLGKNFEITGLEPNEPKKLATLLSGK